MRHFFSRMSYFTTLAVPIAVALIIAFTGLAHPEWPRIYFIIGFLAALILLPGVTLGLKLGSTPITEEDVEFTGVYGRGVIGVRFANGEVVRYPHNELYNLFINGGIEAGEPLRLRFLDQDIISWKSLKSKKD
ncbi:MAG: hypothetical protein AB1426_04290 [Bacillota bacterium]